MSSALRDRLQADLRAAMKARDKVTVSALRVGLAALANAEAVPVADVPRAGAIEAAPVGVSAEAPRLELSVDDEHRVLSAEAADLRDSGLDDQAAVLAAYLA